MGGVILHQAAAGLLRLHDEHDIPSASRLPADQAERGVLPVVHDEAGRQVQCNARLRDGGLQRAGRQRERQPDLLQQRAPGSSKTPFM